MHIIRRLIILDLHNTTFKHPHISVNVYSPFIIIISER